MLENDSLTSPTKARSKLARLHMGGDPDPDLKRLLKADLACANIDNKVREQLVGARLQPVHVGHLVGLLLMESGVDGANVTLIEKLVREAVDAGHKADK
jgi:hypothetical protein